MGKLSLVYTLVLSLLMPLLYAQDGTKPGISRQSLSLSGLRFASAASVTYGCSIYQTNTFNLGAQGGIGYGPKDWEAFSQLVLPIGIFAEYGKKHRIGIDANVMYQYKTQTILGFSGSRVIEYDAVYTNGVFSTSIFYNYNFGDDQNYILGLGANYLSYFGSNYGEKYEINDAIAPFIYLGYRF